MPKIEIKGSLEDLQRIATFLENNHLKHDVVDDLEHSYALEELSESINWPL